MNPGKKKPGLGSFKVPSYHPTGCVMSHLSGLRRSHDMYLIERASPVTFSTVLPEVPNTTELMLKERV